MVLGKFSRVAALSILSMAVPSEAPGARLNEIVTDGNCPWWLIASGSVVVSICVKALSGIARAPTEDVVVFGVVPAMVPAAADDPAPELVPPSTDAEGFRAFEEGVYRTPVVSAFEPAEADAEDENE